MNKPIPTETLAGAPSTEATHDEPSFPEVLERMTSAERLRAYRSGAFTPREVSIWAARFPEEVPIVNGEFEWIALTMADLD
jgi:hypothetical protein